MNAATLTQPAHLDWTSLEVVADLPTDAEIADAMLSADFDDMTGAGSLARCSKCRSALRPSVFDGPVCVSTCSEGRFWSSLCRNCRRPRVHCAC